MALNLTEDERKTIVGDLGYGAVMGPKHLVRVEKIIQRRMAQAWEEGVAAGGDYESKRVSPDPDDWDGLKLPINPYEED